MELNDSPPTVDSSSYAAMDGNNNDNDPLSSTPVIRNRSKTHIEGMEKLEQQAQNLVGGDDTDDVLSDDERRMREEELSFYSASDNKQGDDNIWGLLSGVGGNIYEWYVRNFTTSSSSYLQKFLPAITYFLRSSKMPCIVFMQNRNTEKSVGLGVTQLQPENRSTTCCVF